MEIRLIEPSECAGLGRITVEAFRQLNGSEPLGSYEDELLDVATRSVDSEVYVALDDDGRLMGGVTYVPGPDRAMAEFRDPRGCGIRMLAVGPAFQQRGAGRALVERCVDRARTQQRRRIILHSAPAMTTAQEMYVKMGFARAPELDEFIDGANRETLHLRAFTMEV